MASTAIDLKPNDPQIRERRPNRPGLRSFLVAILAFFALVASLRSEQIVVWMLARDLVTESGADSLPSTIQNTGIIAAILFGAFAWRLIAWPISLALPPWIVSLPRLLLAHLLRATDYAMREFMRWVEVIRSKATVSIRGAVALLSSSGRSLASSTLALLSWALNPVHIVSRWLKNIWRFIKSTTSAVIGIVIGCAGYVESQLEKAFSLLWRSTRQAIDFAMGSLFVIAIKIRRVLNWMLHLLARPARVLILARRVVIGLSGISLIFVWKGTEVLVGGVIAVTRLTLGLLVLMTGRGVRFWRVITALTAYVTRRFALVMPNVIRSFLESAATVSRRVLRLLTVTVTACKQQIFEPVVRAVMFLARGLWSRISQVIAKIVSWIAFFWIVLASTWGAVAGFFYRSLVRAVRSLVSLFVALVRPVWLAASLITRTLCRTAVGGGEILRMVVRVIWHTVKLFGNGVYWPGKWTLVSLVQLTIYALKHTGKVISFGYKTGAATVGLLAGFARQLVRLLALLFNRVGARLAAIASAAVKSASSARVAVWSAVKTRVVQITSPVVRATGVATVVLGHSLRVALLTVTRQANHAARFGLRLGGYAHRFLATAIKGIIKELLVAGAAVSQGLRTIASLCIRVGFLPIGTVTLAVTALLLRSASAMLSRLAHDTGALIALFSRMVARPVVAVVAAVGQLWAYVSRAIEAFTRRSRGGVSSLSSELAGLITNLIAHLERVPRALNRKAKRAGRQAGTGLASLIAESRKMARVIVELGPTVAMVLRARSVDLGEKANRALHTTSTAIAVAVIVVAGGFSYLGFTLTRPEPPLILHHWTTDDLTHDGLLNEMAARFNSEGHLTQSGRRFEVRVTTVSIDAMIDFLTAATPPGGGSSAPSRNSDEYLGDRSELPTIVTAPSTHWFTGLNHSVGQELVGTESAEIIASTTVGVATYRDMAECLGWPASSFGFDDLWELKSDPDGWSSTGCPHSSWGRKPLVSFTDPATSSVSRSVLINLYAKSSETAPAELAMEDVSDPTAEAYIHRFQDMIDRFSGDSAAMVSAIEQGRRFGHFFVTSQADLARLSTEENRTGSDAMVMMYPEEGAIVHRFCACVVQGDWVSEEESSAAQTWSQYLLEEPQHTRFVNSGFRSPVSAASASGLVSSGPKFVDVANVLPDVNVGIIEAWSDIKRPSVVVYAIDTSGSMLGPKMGQAKAGLTAALDGLSPNSQTGLVRFSDSVTVAADVRPLSDVRATLDMEIDRLSARGETALYDAVETAVRIADEADSPPGTSRAVVVLTDGQANRGDSKLDDVVRMESVNEKAIAQFDGLEGGGRPVQSDGVEVSVTEIFGVDLLIETEHEIQVFLIGIGGDVNLDVARVLAEATGAEFKGVAGDDLANVLEQFSGYF